MTYGLGFDSPVKLKLGKENYEALIERHGQYVRWRTSIKCACVTGDGNQPDIRCPTCGGTGIIYSYQKDERRINTLPVGKDGAVTLSERSDGDVKAVYCNGVSVPFIKYGKFLKLEGVRVGVDDYVAVETSYSRENAIASVAIVSVGGGFYRVPGCRSEASAIQSVVHTAPGDILSCTINDDEKEFEILEFRMDMVRIRLTDPTTDAEIAINGALKATNVKWLEPSKFVILSQGFNEVDTKMIETAGGDAVLTAPYCCDIGEGDVITVLSGSTLAKEVLFRKEGAEDTISAFFVESIERIFSTVKEYRPGVDFVLAGTNKVVWITTPPAPDTAYSILYKVLPTYTVIKNLPSLRTSEDQRMPRRAVLKLFAAYKEGRRVNQND